MKPLQTAFYTCLALLMATMLLGDEPGAANLTTRFSGEQSKAPRLREGAKFHDRVGRFQVQGERVNFLPDDKSPESIRVLENLALERVSNGLIDPRSPNRWIVSGTVTEYRGNNYLLITRAVMREGNAKSP
jgi:hypothetical protein